MFQAQVTNSEFQILYEIYVSSYQAVSKNVCIGSEKSGFCFSIFLVKLG